MTSRVEDLIDGLPSSEPAPRKAKRTFSKNTKTWQLFDRLFLRTDPSEYPIVLGPYTKGQALNLSIGMNTCHVQHMRETGMPEENMLYSAKPKKQGEEWIVEISTNYTRTGQTKPSRTGKDENWMDKILEQVKVSTPAEFKKPVDKQEDLLASLYGLGEGDKK